MPDGQETKPGFPGKRRAAFRPDLPRLAARVRRAGPRLALQAAGMTSRNARDARPAARGRNSKVNSGAFFSVERGAFSGRTPHGRPNKETRAGAKRRPFAGHSFVGETAADRLSSPPEKGAGNRRAEARGAAVKRLALKFFAVLGAMAGLGALAGTALAGEERACAAQYALEDHVLLEWAALGGDPHAQMAIAQCAFPQGADVAAMTPAEKTYAIRWTTIALCEAAATPAHDRRDVRLRKLKENASISFRRFGGLAKTEKLNWREKDFMEYRREQTALLADRHRRLVESVSAAELGKARGELSEQLSRMGPTGLLKLAELSSCDAFGASKAFEAAAWSAALDAWRGAEVAGIYAAADSDDYDLPAIAAAKMKKLSAPDRRVATLEKERLLRTEPKRLAALEQKAGEAEEAIALQRLADFRLPSRRAEGGLFDAAPAETPATTTALQFALESLGHVDFVNGPDNDYGKTTQQAVARYQESAGKTPTAMLTNAELRGAICLAAAKDDPVSLYHVALMYQNGWGFPKSDAKAAAAIRRSENAMISALGGGDLPAWKRDAYASYAGKIRAASAEMKRPGVETEAAICD